MKGQWVCLWVGQSCKICKSSTNKQAAGAYALLLLYLQTVNKPLWIFCLTSCWNFASVSPWLFAATSASASLATSAAVRLETAPTPVRDVARMRWACLFHCVCLFFVFAWFIHQEIQCYTFIGSLREGQVWSGLLPVCWKFHRRGLWIKVWVCLHCWR